MFPRHEGGLSWLDDYVSDYCYTIIPHLSEETYIKQTKWTYIAAFVLRFVYLVITLSPNSLDGIKVALPFWKLSNISSNLVLKYPIIFCKTLQQTCLVRVLYLSIYIIL
jgi:lipid-A-disaccharide synthase-like uncharacterized protein